MLIVLKQTKPKTLLKKNLISFLLNPFVISALIASIIIWILPEYFSKYKINFESKEYVSGNNIVVYFTDLDGDFRSEKITVHTNTLGNAAFNIYNSDGDLIDQYNTKGQYPNPFKRYWFQDGDANGMKEIYTLVVKNDSIFLNVFEVKSYPEVSFKECFVDTIVKFENDYAFGFINSFSGIQRHEGYKDVTFSITAGYSCYPRNIYKYNPFTNTVLKSPYITNSMGANHKYDLDSDGKLEYFLGGNSPGNANVKNYSPRSDYSTWAIVLDNDLNFLFSPIEFPALGRIDLIANNQHNTTSIIGIYGSKEYGKEYSRLFKLDQKGSFIKEQKLPRGIYSNLFEADDSYFLYESQTGLIKEFDSDLELLNQTQLIPNSVMYFCDINFDSENEWIGVDNNWNSITIWESNFKHPVSLDISQINGMNVCYGIRYLNKNKLYLYFQRGNYIAYYSYTENPLYPLKYLIYIGIFGFILFFIWLILQGQKLREAKKRALEHEIADLQLKTLKNQVDPHFVFNAINTISEMTLMDNKLEADQFISEFSDLMRKTLSRSDKITTTLEDELAYVKNYLRLQQIRHSHKFDFEVQVNTNINTKLLIPKHSIYTFIENAIKYGLPKNKKGFIKVSVYRDVKNVLVFNIEDNGEGLNQNLDKKLSTGNGLKIIKQIFDLYSKRFGTKIDYELTPLLDENNTILGTRAQVKMRLKKSD